MVGRFESAELKRDALAHEARPPFESWKIGNREGTGKNSGGDDSL